MFEFIARYLRKKNLKKALLPPPVKENPEEEEEEVIPQIESKEVKSLLVLVDIKDLTWKDLRNRAMKVFLERCYNGQVIFVCTDKLDKKEVITTPPDQTITTDDMSWSGKPVTDKIPELVKQRPDVLINLISDTGYMMEYIIKASGARFKVGRTEFPENGYDMLLEDSAEGPLSPLECFDAIIEYMDKMRWMVL